MTLNITAGCCCALVRSSCDVGWNLADVHHFTLAKINTLKFLCLSYKSSSRKEKVVHRSSTCDKFPELT